MKLWICLVLLAIGASKAQDDDYNAFPDSWDDYQWFSDEVENLGIISAEDKPVENVPNPVDNNQIKEDNILEELDKEEDKEDSESFDNFNDYQFEDNRFEHKEMDNPEDDFDDNRGNDKGELGSVEEEIQADSKPEDNVSINDVIDEDNLNSASSIEEEANDDVNDDDDVTDASEDSVVEEEIKVDIPEPNNKENQEIFDETRNILKEDDANGNDFADVNQDPNDDIFDETIIESDKIDADDEDANVDADSSKDEMDAIFEKLLNIKEDHDSDVFDSDERAEDKEIELNKPEINNEQVDNDAFVNEAIADMAKLDEVVWEDSSEETLDAAPEIEGNDEDKQDDVKEEELVDEKGNDGDTYDKVYADLDDDFKQLFDTWDKLTKNDEKVQDDVSMDDVLEYEVKYGKPFREDVVLSQREDYENMDEVNDNVEDTLDDLFADDNILSDLFDDKEDDGLDNANDMVLLPSKEKQEPIFYNDDALLADKDSDEGDKKGAEIEDNKSEEMPPEPIKTISVHDLNPRQYDDMMRQFVSVHPDILDVGSDEVPANRTEIFTDRIISITSPGYPNNYPAANNVEWILEGNGTGIELNITDVSFVATREDYLLIIPGGKDDSNIDGLLFASTLSQPRRYRFTDVDRLFIRFVTQAGLMTARGFNLTVKLIGPVPVEPVPEPEPEVFAPFPTSRTTVFLGGVRLDEFPDISDEFRHILADMATMYIHANRIDMGINTTYEVTQITNVSLCRVNWPTYENCTAVRFGVPLIYDVDHPGPHRLNEEDLNQMWNDFADEDPIRQRLRDMGVQEFSVPDDGRMLMVWLVIAGGVLIAMAMLAFALWRFSCFEDYTRMAAFSDTDSLSNEKRGLDLYPTPHQPLPPMYEDVQYRWEDEDPARVDMGGLANRSYVRDDMYDLESDEEVVTSPRDRNMISSRDIHPV